MTKKKLALVIKLAEKLSDEALMKLASDNMTATELKKLAAGEGVDTVLNALKAPFQALGTETAGNIGMATDAAGRLGGAWEATKQIPGVVAAHPGPSAGIGIAGGLATAAGLYLAHKALQNMYGGSEDEGNERLASAKAELPAATRAELDKLAADPGVSAACYTLAKHGLI